MQNQREQYQPEAEVSHFALGSDSIPKVSVHTIKYIQKHHLGWVVVVCFAFFGSVFEGRGGKKCIDDNHHNDS